MEVIRGAHGVDNDVRECTRVKALNLNVVAKGGEVTVQGTKLSGAPVIVSMLRRRNCHLHSRTVGMWSRVLGFHMHESKRRRRKRRIKKECCWWSKTLLHNKKDECKKGPIPDTLAPDLYFVFVILISFLKNIYI